MPSSYQRRNRQGFSRVDEEGNIPIPPVIRRNAGLEPGQVVEVRHIGGGCEKQTITLVVYGKGVRG